MKILFINFEYPPIGGGGGVANKILIEELAKRHKITIITSGFKGLPSKEKSGNINVLRVPVMLRKSTSTSTIPSLVSFLILSIVRGVIYVKKGGFDLVHSVSAIPSALTGVYLSRKLSVPHVLTVIGGDIHDPTRKLSPSRNFLTRFIAIFVIQISDVVISPSSELANRIRALFKPKKLDKQITVIPWGFDKPKYTFKKLTKIKEDKVFRIITLTRLVKRKGLEYLLRAVNLLPEEDIKLSIVGDGPEMEYLQRLSKKLKISEKVTFTGFVSDKDKYNLLLTSDCFILPTLHEAFGLVFQEAMYCGLPIITTNAGGQTDFLKHKKNGLIVPIKDPKAIAKSIKTLIYNNGLREEISRNNKREINDFLITRIVKKYEDIYLKLIM